jgi:carboxypeptidase C (cathepsin A)
MEGLLIEHGPFLAAERGFDLELNFFSWNRNANVLYIDQPVGTGFARVENGAYARSQGEINVMFMAFLHRWMNLHPRFINYPIYLAGESYAGRYIPHFVREMNRVGGFNIQGVLIGNGWTYPIIQSAALIDYSLGHGILSPHQRKEVDNLMRACQASYDLDPYSERTWDDCEKIQTIPPELSGNSQIGRLNIYDLRLYDTSGGEEWPWRATGEHAYLNRPDVRRALHVRSVLSWEECSDDVERALTHEDMYPSIKEFEALLPQLRVLVYNGQFDWICNHMGVERFLHQIDFPGREEFSRRGLWVTGSRLAGYVNAGGNLTYVLVLGGSHMVPMDKRPETFDLVMRFLRNQSLTDIILQEPAPGAVVTQKTPGSHAPIKTFDREQSTPLPTSEREQHLGESTLEDKMAARTLMLILVMALSVTCWLAFSRKRVEYTRL